MIDNHLVKPPILIKNRREVISDAFLFTSLLPPSTLENVFLTTRHTRYEPPYCGRLVVPGQFTASTVVSVSSFTPIALRAYYVPFMVPIPLSLDQLGIRVNTFESNKEARLGVFSVELGKVTKAVYSNILGMDFTGTRVTPVDISLDPGAYALAFLTEASTAEVRQGALDYPILGYENPEDINPITHWYEDKTLYSDGFSDNPTTSVGKGVVPHIFARVS